MKSRLCLAAVAVFLFVTGVGAELPRYVVSEGVWDSLFSVRRNNEYVPGAKNVSMDSALSVIRRESYGDSVEIHFDTTDGGVFIDANKIEIEQRPDVVPRWGSVTLTGAVRSSVGGAGVALRLDGGRDTLMLNVASSLDITVDGRGDAVRVHGNARLTLDKCKISTMEGTGVNSGDLNSEVIIMGGEFKSKTTGSAVYVCNNLEISGGKFESAGSSTVHASGDTKISGGEFTYKTFAARGGALETYGDVEITGGVFTAAKGGRAMRVVRGEVRISQNAEFRTADSDTGATIVLAGGSVVLDGGYIENKQNENTSKIVPIGRAFNIASAKSTLTICGFTPPEIIGTILYRVPGAVRMKVECLWGGGGKYVLEPAGGARVDGAVAVAGGGAYLDKFEYIDENYEIDRVGNDIDIFLKPGVKPMGYLITGDTVSGFTAVERGSGYKFGKESKFQTLFDSVRVHAGGKPCSLFLGEGNSGLNVAGFGLNGGMNFSGFKGNGWGRVTLLGKLICRRPPGAPPAPSFGLYVTNGASVENYADITVTGHLSDVYVATGSDYVHAAGKLSSSISNGNDYMLTSGGTVTVKGGNVPQIVNIGEGAALSVVGGTVGDTASRDYAIRNDQYCEVFIADTAKIVSANTNFDGGTIVNNGVLEIYGGKVSNVGVSKQGVSVAVNNGYDEEDATSYPTVEISGTAEIFSKNIDGATGVVYNRRGEITISGGAVYNDADTVGSVIVNYGILTVSGDAYIESKSRYSNYNAKGTIYSPSVDASGYASALNIVGGKVKAKDGYAVYSDSSGGVTVSGDAEITSADPDGAIYIGADGYLKLLGGKVSSTADEKYNAEILAVDAYAGGQRGAPGRLEMGGSPKVDGIISLPGLEKSPITVLAVDYDYPFDPDGETYHIAARVKNGNMILENGAGFIHSFVLDTAGNAGLKLAVNGNDVVATNGRIYYVDFSVNGSTDGYVPAAIPVVEDGTIGELAKPSTKNYKLQNGGYIIKNDGEWYIRSIVDNVEHVGDIFEFGVGSDGTPVKEKLTLILLWTGDSIKVSVQEPTRDLPPARPAESALIMPIASSSGGLTVGPIPVSKSSGLINFFRSGAALKNGKLFVYDASGNIVTKVIVNDNYGGIDRRPVAKWNLQDAKGRNAAEGTYVAKGVITTKAGKTERVSILINVRK